MVFHFQSLLEAQQTLRDLPAPIIVFNKSHSGSRLLARLLDEAGVFIGAHRNESEDALPLVELVEAIVTRHFPDFSGLLCHPKEPSEIARLVAETLSAHLEGYAGGPWGWKLCETTYILPVLAYLFPAGRFVHLIRDGRDVAFCNHVAPKQAYWQKVYINTDRLPFWNGLFFGRHSRSTYRLVPHLYNIQHWCNSVTLGRRFGSMLGENYCEVRYESLCSNFVAEARRVLQFAGITAANEVLTSLSMGVNAARVGRFRKESPLKVWQVTRRAAPLLSELGYLEG